MAAQVLETIAGSNGHEHHIKRSKDGAVYCTCTGWKFSKLSPKTCKHLEDWHAKQASKTARVVAGTIVANRQGKEFVAVRRITGPNEVWAWEDDRFTPDPIIEPFDPSMGERIVGHVADRLAAALGAVSSPVTAAALFVNRTLYAVICRADRTDAGPKGDYELATRRIFEWEQDAIDYAVALSSSREPIVVEGNWRYIAEHGAEHSSRVAVRVTRSYLDGCIGAGVAFSPASNPPGTLRIVVAHALLRLPGADAPHQHVPQGQSVFETLDWL